MAAFRRILLRLQNNTVSLRRSFEDFQSSKKCLQYVLFGATGFGMYMGYKSYRRHFAMTPQPLLPALKAKEEGQNEKEHSTNYREIRFRQFASVEYDNNIYMTPQDFLESLTEESPRPRIGRQQLTESDLDQMLKHTPALSKGSDKLFRKLHDKGIISYTEYLFLLCVLTKPHSGFLIAFNMFDTDGNQIVDKKEFLVLENFFILPRRERKFVPRDPKNLNKLLDLEKVFSGKDEGSGTGGQAKDTGPQRLRRSVKDLNSSVPDTTLLVHFFGRSGKNVLKYKDFHRFMENLQSEVIELEFLEFSKGLNTISELEFARILLRYTNLDRGDVEECLQRVRDRMPNEKGITFAEFKKFCQFLNNLDDFAIAMKMYTFAQQPVSKEEFQRAVKVCTGFTLESHIVHTVFNIFDQDGDGHLSHKEFISIMKDRLHRGARSHLMHHQNTWDAFKTCVKNEMRSF